MAMLKKMLLLVISAAGMTAFGQSEPSKTRFVSMADCKSAVESGEFTNYSPSFMNRHREPAQGEEIRPLEERACVEMDIVGGRAFVPQPAGEKFVFTGNQPVVRYDCGNGVYSIEYIPIPPPPSPPAPAPVPPAPPAEPEVTLPPAEPPVEIEDLPPAPDWPEARQFQVVLTWDKGRKFPIPCWPREKGWYGTGIPIISCAAIVTGVVLPFMGGADAVAAIAHKIGRWPIGGVLPPP